jgi:hypothetical protein
MSDSLQPRSRDVLRASDDDRNLVVQLLANALGRGQLTLTEYEARTDHATRARTYADLDLLIADLPLDGGGPPAPSYWAPLSALAGVPRLGEHKVGVLSGPEVRGPIAVGAEHTLAAFWGGVLLDLREATFTARDLTLHCYAVMGGITIVVPRGVTVQVDGLGVMGAFVQNGVITGDPHGPRVTVRGVAFWGGVHIRQR